MKVNEVIKVAIADDHNIFRDGLKTLLKKIKVLHLEVVGDVENGEEAVKLAKSATPDVILMDIQMPVMDGIDATAKIKEHELGVKVIALSTFSELGMVTSMLEAGVDGYLLKNTSKEELSEAIATVFKGGKYFTPDEKVQYAVKDFNSNTHKHQPLKVKLTPREIEVLKLVCREMSNKEIASALEIGIRTVETYRERITQKVGAKNLAGLVMFAIKEKLLASNNSK
jgi:DNA-binding NarL/FixJ family response regulator